MPPSSRIDAARIIMKALLVCGLLANPSGASASPLTLDQAIHRALLNSPILALARLGTDGQRAQVQRESGAFDWIFGAEASHNYVDGALSGSQELKDQLSIANLGLDKRFGFGLNVRPFVDLSRRHTQISGQGGLSAEQNAARLGLALTQPLLRNRGSAGRVALDVAEHRFEASEADLGWVAAQVVKGVAQGYWAYRGLAQQFVVLQEAEQHTTRLLTDTEALVQAQQRPAGDLELIRAALADRQRVRIEAEQALRSAQFALGLMLGAPADSLQGLGIPSTPLPTAAGAQPAAGRPLSQIQEHRLDLKAARSRLKAAQAELAAAQSNTLPQLDASANAGVNFVDDNQGQSLVAALGASSPGISVGVALQLSLPVQNRTQEGVHAAQRALHRSAEISLADLVRRARAAVRLSTERVKARAAAAERAEAARGAYARAVENEALKVRSGVSTLLDLIVFQDRLINAQIIAIDTKVRFASALAELQFVNGAMGPEGIVPVILEELQ